MGLLSWLIAWLEAETERLDKENELKLKEFSELYHFHQGLRSPEQARTHEDILLTEPDNMSSRVCLLSYYQTVLFRSEGRQKEEARQQYFRHIYWFIENAPASKVIKEIQLAHRFLNEQEFSVCIAVWNLQLTRFPKDTGVIGNFADFIWLSDRQKRSEERRVGKECRL